MIMINMKKKKFQKAKKITTKVIYIKKIKAYYKKYGLNYFTKIYFIIIIKMILDIMECII